MTLEKEIISLQNRQFYGIVIKRLTTTACESHKHTSSVLPEEDREIETVVMATHIIDKISSIRERGMLARDSSSHRRTAHLSE